MAAAMHVTGCVVEPSGAGIEMPSSLTVRVEPLARGMGVGTREHRVRRERKGWRERIKAAAAHGSP
tara:strand:+ start:1064 stop:1261 length:198 start_codon:yes stop_codon:yes gene_type:complete